MNIPFTELILATPEWLLLLLFLPLWLLLGRRDQNFQLNFAGTPELVKLVRSSLDWITGLKYVCFWIGFILLVIAMARPQKQHSYEEEKVEVVDIILAIDVSLSMGEDDFVSKGRREQRIDAAKRNAIAFVEQRGGDRIGAVAYAARPYIVSPITLDQEWVKEQISQLTLYDLPREDGGTAIGSAISAAYTQLSKKETKSKVIVLLTDGSNNSGKISPLEAAELCAVKEVKIHTIGIGTEEGRLSQNIQRFPKQEFDIKTLQEIAKITGGVCFRAKSTEQLANIFDEIDKLETTEVKVRTTTIVEEKFWWWLFAGFCALTVGILLQVLRLPPLP